VTNFHLLDRQDREKAASRDALRKLVANFIASHHASEKMHFLGLPGETWRFEKILVERYPRAVFTGVEKIGEVFRRAARGVPIRGRFNYGTKHSGRIVRGDWVSMVGESTFNLVFDRLSDTMERLDFSALPVTAAWLDFTGMISLEVHKCLSRLAGICSKTAPTIPIAITLFNGREGRDWYNLIARLGGREEYVRKTISGHGREFVIRGSKTYSGYSINPRKPSSMLEIFGTLE